MQIKITAPRPFIPTNTTSANQQAATAKAPSGHAFSAANPTGSVIAQMTSAALRHLAIRRSASASSRVGSGHLKARPVIVRQPKE
jgi:hypothetical protein